MVVYGRITSLFRWELQALIVGGVINVSIILPHAAHAVPIEASGSLAPIVNRRRLDVGVGCNFLCPDTGFLSFGLNVFQPLSYAYLTTFLEVRPRVF